MYSSESGEIEIGMRFCSDMDEVLQSTDQSTDREGGDHEGRKRGSNAREGECQRDTDQDLEAVLLCPVIDERRCDKGKKERTEREEGMENRGVKKGQQKAFYYLSSNRAVGEGISA